MASNDCLQALLFGTFTLGVMDVDARTGEPIPLTDQQIHNLKERARAIIEFQTQTAAA